MYHLFDIVQLEKNRAQAPLSNVALWALGELGEHLFTGDGAKAASLDQDTVFQPVSEKDVLQTIHKILSAPSAPLLTKEYGLTAVAKLAARMSSAALGRPEVAELLRALTSLFSDDASSVELQQRSVEYAQLIELRDLARLRTRILAKMPLFKKVNNSKRKGGAGGAEDGAEDGEEKEGKRGFDCFWACSRPKYFFFFFMFL